MQRDIATAKQLGADGVVFGILLEDGTIDVARTRQLLDAARPLKVTFHRAFDMSRDLDESLQALIDLGVDRVLTSGGKDRIEDAIPTVARLVKAAKGRIVILAGGGISEANAGRVVRETGVREIHAALRDRIDGPMRFRKGDVPMGALKGAEYERFVLHEDRVRRLVKAAG